MLSLDDCFPIISHITHMCTVQCTKHKLCDLYNYILLNKYFQFFMRQNQFLSEGNLRHLYRLGQGYFAMTMYLIIMMT